VSFRDRARPGNRVWFTLDGEDFHVEIDTPLLLDVLTGTTSWTKIVPGATDEPLYLWQRLLDPADAFDLPDCERIVESVIQALTGWPPHAAYALAHLVDTQWAVISMRATAGGQDLLKLPVRRVLDFAYGLRIENADEKDRREVDDALLRPRMPKAPKRKVAAGDSYGRPGIGSSPPPGFTVAEQEGSFMSAMAMIGSAQS
jgi:hypothetical protein